MNEEKADYYDVLYLKRVDTGIWEHRCESYPTLELAEAQAKTLRQGAQSAVSVKARFWE